MRVRNLEYSYEKTYPHTGKDSNIWLPPNTTNN